MAAFLLDGVAMAAEVLSALRPRVDALAARGVQPGLATVLVGDSPASRSYVRNKLRTCADSGVHAPCTPLGVMKMLERAGVQLEARHAVVIGRSSIVGKPLALMLIAAGATVTVCNSKTPDLGAFTRSADILVAAAGRARLVTPDMVKHGAVV